MKRIITNKQSCKLGQKDARNQLYYKLSIMRKFCLPLARYNNCYQVV